MPFQFQCVSDGRYEATYDGGYASIGYRYHRSAQVMFMTGINIPDEAALLADFIDWVW